MRDDDALWAASGGLLGQRLSFQEKLRQAKDLEKVLDGFSTSDEEDDEDLLDHPINPAATWSATSYEATLAAAARTAAKAAAQAVSQLSHGTTAQDDGATSYASSSLPSSSSGFSCSSGGAFSSRGGAGSRVPTIIAGSAPPSSCGSMGSHGTDGASLISSLAASSLTTSANRASPSHSNVETSTIYSGISAVSSTTVGVVATNASMPSTLSSCGGPGGVQQPTPPLRALPSVRPRSNHFPPIGQRRQNQPATRTVPCAAAAISDPGSDAPGSMPRLQ